MVYKNPTVIKTLRIAFVSTNMWFLNLQFIVFKSKYVNENKCNQIHYKMTNMQVVVLASSPIFSLPVRPVLQVSLSSKWIWETQDRKSHTINSLKVLVWWLRYRSNRQSWIFVPTLIQNNYDIAEEITNFFSILLSMWS